jgi:hypothetical protein
MQNGRIKVLEWVRNMAGDFWTRDSGLRFWRIEDSSLGDGDTRLRLNTQVSKIGDSGFMEVQPLYFPGDLYSRLLPRMKVSTFTLSSPLILSSKSIDLPFHSLELDSHVGFQGEDLDLHLHQRNFISPFIPLRSLLLLGS